MDYVHTKVVIELQGDKFVVIYESSSTAFIERQDEFKSLKAACEFARSVIHSPLADLVLPDATRF